MTAQDALHERLSAGLIRLDLALDAAQIRDLLAFLALLRKWGETYNLTAIREPLAMVDRHLLDSLAVAPFLAGEAVLDVGTGAGLPGIPLAIALRQKRFVLLDSSAKKIRFVKQVILTLGLENVQAEAMRVEEYVPAQGFDVVLARAFAGLDVMQALTRRLLRPGGRLLALKGRLPVDEMARLQQAEMLRVHPLSVPGLEAERHLIEIGA